MTEPARRRARARIEGTVQGVGFRPYVHRLAGELELAGYVRNDERGVVLEVEGDALIALSTSGNSRNVIEALAEARRRGMRTIALVGYDGGRVAAEQLADHVIVTRSEHIPRIQEAQAGAYHVLRELVER